VDSNKRVVIFDFDGTLADTAPLMRAIYTDLATKNHWKPMTDVDFAVLRKGSIRDAKRWSGLHFWQFPSIIRSAKKLMVLEAEKVILFDGIPELIKRLHDQDVDLYVLSRNLPHTVSRVLDRTDLSQYVTVLTIRKRSLGSKTASIRRLLRKNSYDPNNVWMVGDEIRDVMAGLNAGVKSLAVTWGLQDESVLALQKPTAMAHTVDEMAKILQS
jgi:phosphoglycolate phosphatase